MQLRLLVITVLLSCAGAARAAEPDDNAAEIGLVRALADGQADILAKQFNETLSAKLKATELAAAWDALVKDIGAFESMVEVERRRQSGYDVARVWCRFTRGPAGLEIVRDDKGLIAGLHFTRVQHLPELPPYAKRDAFVALETQVASGKYRLPAVLTVPKGAGPFPAVVLVHGSGPLDRDENVGELRPFKDIACGLASRGIAVLRYDKRTFVYGSAAVPNTRHFTVNDEVIEDAVAAVHRLSQEKSIDQSRIGIAGHSLGGMLAPRIARAEPALRYIIVLCGNSRPLEDVLVDQLERRAKGGNDKSIEAQVRSAVAAAAQIKSRDLRSTELVNFAGALMPGSYWLDLRGYEPAQVAAALHRPVLVIHGGRDGQLSWTDYDGWYQALQRKPQVKMQVFDRLDHFLSTDGHVDIAVIDLIDDWIDSESSATSRPGGS